MQHATKNRGDTMKCISMIWTEAGFMSEGLGILLRILESIHTHRIWGQLIWFLLDIKPRCQGDLSDAKNLCQGQYYRVFHLETVYFRAQLWLRYMGYNNSECVSISHSSVHLFFWGIFSNVEKFLKPSKNHLKS